MCRSRPESGAPAEWGPLGDASRRTLGQPLTHSVSRYVSLLSTPESGGYQVDAVQGPCSTVFLGLPFLQIPTPPPHRSPGRHLRSCAVSRAIACSSDGPYRIPKHSRSNSKRQTKELVSDARR